MLALEAWLAGRRRHSGLLVAAAAVLAVAYSIGYTRPAIGMVSPAYFTIPGRLLQL